MAKKTSLSRDMIDLDDPFEIPSADNLCLSIDNYDDDLKPLDQNEAKHRQRLDREASESQAN